MKTEYLNGGNPLPTGHRKAGQIGVMLDFEDGRPEPQYVYAESKEALADKLLTMYGSASLRVQELKKADRTPSSAPGAPAATAPTAPAAPARMTADERMQAAADITDPAKAPSAIRSLIKDEFGVDLQQQAEQRRQTEEHDRRVQATADFLRDHPDYVPTQRNAVLLRDRTFARVGANFTEADLAESFQALQDLGVLESAPSTQHQPATNTGEPTAPPPQRPRGSTGIPPTQLRGGRGPAPGGPSLTRAAIIAMSETEEYEERLRTEPGFQAKVDAVLSRT